MPVTRDSVLAALDAIAVPGGTLVSRDMVRALTVEGGAVRFVIEAPSAEQARLMEPLGVQTEYVPDGVMLRRVAERSVRVAMNFTDCPDLAQTIAVAAAATGVVVDMTGLESLRIKETDRISALQTELAKFGARMTAEGKDMFRVSADALHVGGQAVETYHDHRMAMAFAPLALRGPLTIEAPAVVRKSYPFFWEELRQAGFQL